MEDGELIGRWNMVQWAITKPVEESMYVYRWFGLLAVGMKMFEVSQLESGYVISQNCISSPIHNHFNTLHQHHPNLHSTNPLNFILTAN